MSSTEESVVSSAFGKTNSKEMAAGRYPSKREGPVKVFPTAENPIWEQAEKTQDL